MLKIQNTEIFSITAMIITILINDNNHGIDTSRLGNHKGRNDKIIT